MEEYAYPSNNEKSRKHRKSNEALCTGELLRVITAIKFLARTDWMYQLQSNYPSDMYSLGVVFLRC